MLPGYSPWNAGWIIQRNQTFAVYYKSNADQFAMHVIKTLNEPEIVREAWNRNPEEFPHFTAFVKLFAYIHYDAQRNQNSPLDSNWLPDAEQLCFLAEVDAIVSSERGFMRRAFEALWHPCGKSMFTPDEFVIQLSHIH